MWDKLGFQYWVIPKSRIHENNFPTDMFIKKGMFLKVLWHFVHVLQYYPKLNNGHHTKPRDLYVC